MELAHSSAGHRTDGMRDEPSSDFDARIRYQRSRTRIRRQDRLVRIAPQTLRALAAYPGAAFVVWYHFSPFPPPPFSRNAPAAAVGMGCARVQHILADF